jgi:hypothetical protein
MKERLICLYCFEALDETCYRIYLGKDRLHTVVCDGCINEVTKKSSIGFALKRYYKWIKLKLGRIFFGI